MPRRWTLVAAVPPAIAGLVTAGYAVFAGSSAGQPVPVNIVLCGVGSVGADHMMGSSKQDHPDGSTFMAQQQPQGTQCTANNSSSGNNTWQILHSNVSTDTERGTEHGVATLASTGREAGFNGHITDYDLNSGGDPCTDSAGRTVYYQSGAMTDCTPSFGPVGNFNTHGGASTGDHFRGQYGTIIFQQSSNNHTCDPGSSMYCIEVDLNGQTN